MSGGSRGDTGDRTVHFCFMRSDRDQISGCFGLGLISRKAWEGTANASFAFLVGRCFKIRCGDACLEMWIWLKISSCALNWVSFVLYVS